jgi:hypothetical protein
LETLFTEWLKGIPAVAEEVRVEAGFGSFSTLLIVSLPMALTAYLPRDPAITFLGPITSSNQMPIKPGIGFLGTIQSRAREDFINVQRAFRIYASFYNEFTEDSQGLNFEEFIRWYRGTTKREGEPDITAVEEYFTRLAPESRPDSYLEEADSGIHILTLKPGLK